MVKGPPAKGVGRETGARVRIPCSPPKYLKSERTVFHICKRYVWNSDNKVNKKGCLNLAVFFYSI